MAETTAEASTAEKQVLWGLLLVQGIAAIIIGGLTAGIGNLG